MRVGRTLSTNLSPDHEPLFPEAGDLEMCAEEASVSGLLMLL